MVMLSIFVNNNSYTMECINGKTTSVETVSNLKELVTKVVEKLQKKG